MPDLLAFTYQTRKYKTACEEMNPAWNLDTLCYRGFWWYKVSKYLISRLSLFRILLLLCSHKFFENHYCRTVFVIFHIIINAQQQHLQTFFAVCETRNLQPFLGKISDLIFQTVYHFFSFWIGYKFFSIVSETFSFRQACFRYWLVLLFRIFWKLKLEAFIFQALRNQMLNHRLLRIFFWSVQNSIFSEFLTKKATSTGLESLTFRAAVACSTNWGFSNR